MLHPSYSELMDILNADSNLDNKITSRYAIVIAASKRARQIIAGAEQLTVAPTDKAVSIAVNEIYKGYVRILPEAGQNDNDASEKQVSGGYSGESDLPLSHNDIDGDYGDDFDIGFDDEDFDDTSYDESGDKPEDNFDGDEEE